MDKINLTRKNLVDKVHHKVGFSKNFSSEIIDSFFDLICNELVKLNKIKITSFGTFKMIQKKERIGRNPKTKIQAKIHARRVVKFKAANFLKERINN